MYSVHGVLFLKKLLDEVFLQNEYVKQVSEILEQETEPTWGEEIPKVMVRGDLARQQAWEDVGPN